MPQGRRRSNSKTAIKKTAGKKSARKLSYKQAAKQRASTPVDRIVGTCVRERRIVLGWSQEEFAEKLKISFQQVQKYEAGTNRIGASRLYQIARTLNTDVNHFYGTLPMPGKAAASGQRVAPELREVAKPIAPTPKGKAQESKGQQRAALALVRHYYRIQSPSMRRGLVETVHAFADENATQKGKGAKKATGKKSGKKSTKKSAKKSTKKSAKKKTARKK